MEFGQVFYNLTKNLVETGVFKKEPFTLVDVGCSGGISQFWRIFEPNFLAVGVDPVTAETERLNALENNPAISYMSAFMGLPDDHQFVLRRGNKPVTGNNPWNRLSAHRAAQILSAKIPESEKLPILNNWHGFKLADPVRKIGFSELVALNNLHTLDFIKIDVDGHDMDVLLSAESIIKSAPVIGLALEVDFYGSIDDTDHTFHNTDRLMRSWGFDLFDLTVRRYASSRLPQAFEFDCPAQTKFGRPYQGEALYLRDPCSWSYSPNGRIELSSAKILKLACLFELFSLPDHAAELLFENKSILDSEVSTRDLLNLLAQESQPAGSSYETYLQHFEDDPTSFYPSRLSRP